MRRLVGCVVVAATVAASGSEPSFAASCTALAKQLANVERAAGRHQTRYAGLVRRQRDELRKTEAMRRKMLCGLRKTSECARLGETIDAMNRRIGSLERSGKRDAGTAIRKRMAKAGCSNRRERQSRTITVSVPDRDPTTAPKRERAPALPGRVATICVRTCDGYFFPVSSAIGVDRVREDQLRCAGLCPSAKTTLFTKPVGAPVGAMVDGSGVPYASRPYAYRHQAPDYRHTPRCTCGTPIEPTGPKATLVPAAVATPVPGGLTGGDTDRETRRNAAVSFGWDRARAFSRGRNAPTDRVRVVGPAFVPDR